MKAGGLPPMSSDMQTFLLVDDDKALVKAMTAYLHRRYRDARLLSAQDGEEALMLLHRHQVDLLVTDLFMPVMDGFQLLARLAGDPRTPPVVIISEVATDEDIKPFRGRFPGLTFLPKPFQTRQLGEAVEYVLGRRTRGMIQGLTLSSLLQVLAMEQKSCTLRVSSLGRLGLLHVRDGVLAGAEVEDLTGLDAAYQMLTWRMTRIEIDPSVRPLTEPLAIKVDALVLEATYLRESGQLRESDEVPTPSHRTWTKQVLSLAMHGPGVLATALLDARTGTVVDSLGGQHLEREPFLATMLGQITELGRRPGPQEIGFMLEGRVHLLLPLCSDPRVYLHAIAEADHLDRRSLWAHLSGLAML